MSAVDLSSLAPAYIQRFEPYVPSPPDDVLRRQYGLENLHRLNNNENPLGPPSTSLEAMRRFPLVDAALYPSGCCYHLRRAVAEKHGLSPEQILVGNGANEVIGFVIKAFCEGGDNIVTADRTFTVYEWVARFSGLEVRLAPLRGYDLDPERMVAAIDRRTKVVFVCNPNNPTGTYWSTATFRAFMEAVGPDVVVVLDEAYADYVEAVDFPSGLDMLDDYPNLVIFRTFSKLYGLAGLRVGYLATSESLVNLIRRTCVAYSVNALAQVAAHAALLDPQHVRETLELTSRSRQILSEGLDRLELAQQAGVANYLMISLPMSDTLAYKRLMTEGYMVRPMTSFRYPNYIRVTVGQPPVMQGFLKALGRLLGRESAVA